jgi:hypothetical protein
MDATEVIKVIKFLNASWVSKPLDRTTAAIWGAKLAGHDFGAVMGALDQLLETSEWRPSLAQIIKPLRVGVECGAAEAFANVWEQIAKRPPKVTDIEADAVRQLGGWTVLSGWQINERHFHAQRFRDIYNDIVQDARAEELRAIESGKPSALPVHAEGSRSNDSTQ